MNAIKLRAGSLAPAWLAIALAMSLAMAAGVRADAPAGSDPRDVALLQRTGAALERLHLHCRSGHSRTEQRVQPDDQADESQRHQQEYEKN